LIQLGAGAGPDAAEVRIAKNVFMRYSLICHDAFVAGNQGLSYWFPKCPGGMEVDEWVEVLLAPRRYGVARLPEQISSEM
jgi:hypothetical protein